MLTEGKQEVVQIGYTCCVMMYTLRKAKDITQDDMASKLGISRAMVSQIENGRRLPSVELLQRAADWSGLTIDQLTGMKPVMKVELI